MAHDCENWDAESSGHGEAIIDCKEDEHGNFWAGNWEYGTRVNYCPFCGKKAPNTYKHDSESKG